MLRKGQGGGIPQLKPKFSLLVADWSSPSFSASQPGRVHVPHSPSPPLFYPCGCTDHPAPLHFTSCPELSAKRPSIAGRPAGHRSETLAPRGSWSCSGESGSVTHPCSTESTWWRGRCWQQTARWAQFRQGGAPRYTQWSCSPRIEGSRRRPAPIQTQSRGSSDPVVWFTEILP